MRINYKNNPALKFLLKMEDNCFNWNYTDEATDSEIKQTEELFTNCCITNHSIFKSEITSYSKSILDKVFEENIFQSLIKVAKKENIVAKGTFLLGEIIMFSNLEVVNGLIYGSAIVCYKNGITLFVTHKKSCIISATLKEHSENNNRNPFEESEKILLNLILLILFQKYAQIETKIINPNDKHKFDKDNIFNETKLPITYIDSTWFTNLIISGAFGVKGHFRLQPKKNDKGEWTKELIWINDFEKQGYRRQAKMLKENNHARKTI